MSTQNYSIYSPRIFIRAVLNALLLEGDASDGGLDDYLRLEGDESGHIIIQSPTFVLLEGDESGYLLLEGDESGNMVLEGDAI